MNRKMVPFYSILETSGVKSAFLRGEKKSMERRTTKNKVFEFKKPEK